VTTATACGVSASGAADFIAETAFVAT